MKNLVLLCFILSALSAFADTPPPGTVTAKIQDSAGNALNSTSGALNVNVTGGGGGGTVNQGSAGSQSWLVDVTNTVPVSGTLTCNVGTGTQPVSGTVAVSNFPTSQAVTGTFFQATQPVSGTLTCNAGSGTQNVSVQNSSIPVTGTFWQTTQPVSISGSVTTTNSANGAPGSAVPTQATQIGGTDGTNLRALSVSSAGVLALPTGAATNSELITINSTLGSPFQSGGSIANTSFGISGTLPAYAATPTFNLGTLNGAATDAHLTNVQSAVGTSATTAITIQGSASGVAIPITGTITASNPSIGTVGSTAPTSGTLIGGSDGTNLRAIKVSSTGVQSVDGSAVTQPISAASLPLPTGAFAAGGSIGNTSFGATQSTAANLNATVVGPSGVALAKDSTVAGVTTALGSPFQAGGSIGNTSFTATQATGTNLHTVVDSGAVTATISGTPNVAVTSSALPTGAATAAGLTTINSTLGSPFQAGGSIGNTSFASTQSGTWNITNVSGTVSLPTGASTSAKQPALGTAGSASTDVITVQGIASMTALQVDNTNTEGTVAAGTAATKSALAGQVYSSTVPTLTNGQQIAAQSDVNGNHLVISPDLYFTGQSAQTATVNNIIPATAGANATDALGYHSATVQLIAPAGTYTTGQVIFEGSNDNTNFETIPVYSQLLLTGVPITAAITLATTTSIVYTFPIQTRYIRVRISTAISGASAQVQAFTKLSVAAWSPGVVQVVQNSGANLVTQVSSGNVTTVSTVSTVTSDNLATPSIIADVTSGAIITTTTSATIVPANGVGYIVDIPVTAVTGTTPTYSVAVQESPDTGTNWITVYTFPTITATGSYVSPPLFFRGNRVRYVQTLTGTTPSFTRAINRLQMSAVAAAPVNNNATFATATVSSSCSTLTAPQNAIGFILENLSSNTVNMFWTIGATAATSTTGMLLEPGRDTGEVHSGQNISLCAASGTPTYSLQWLQQ